MSKSIFTFIATILLLLPLVLQGDELSIENQLIICTPLLLFLGIPHGAIDNILFQKKSPTSNFQFILVYLTIVSCNVIIWLTIPMLAYIIFLLFSAYHFGQSQFSGLLSKNQVLTKVLNFAWGVTILTGLIYTNLDEITLISMTNTELQPLESLHDGVGTLNIFWISLISTVSLMVYSFGYKKTDIENLIMELIVLGLILATFYLMPLLIGFTLYFVILHSYKVLREEYFFLKQEKLVQNLQNFIKVLTPFSALSVLGIAFLFGLINQEWLEISYGYCLLIVISSITLPHVFVMDKFYSIPGLKKE